MSKKGNKKAALRGGRLEKGLKRISVSLILGANICTTLLLWLCVALTFVSPDVIPRLSLLTLAFPVFLVVEVLFVLFWLIFYARLAWVPVVGLLVVGGYILDYSPMRLAGDTDGTDSTLTVISYNVGGMSDKEKRTELLDYLRTADADIVCLQEVSTHFLKNHQKWLDSTSYHTLQAGSLAFLSHHPFLSDTIRISFPTRSNSSVACWIDLGGDSLLVINNHLESNHLSEEEKSEYAHTITDPHRQTIKSSSRMLVGKLSEAAGYRGAQADSVCTFVDRHAGHPAIVCGDFNETPVSYVYQQFDRRLVSAYREAGVGPGFSYSRRSFPVRIDHLFHSPHWTCTSYRIDRTISVSDHYPLIVRLREKVQ